MLPHGPFSIAMNRKYSLIGDREAYPALLITVATLLAAAGLWSCMGSPTISACWFYSEFHIYCPGCGCTRALIAMLPGNVITSLYYNPAVLLTSLLIGAYLLSQTLWRLLGKRGPVLHYRAWWMPALFILLAANCLLRNVLWWGFGIPL